MDATEQTADVLVIGAGMLGLIEAAHLRRAGRRALVLGKSRGVGVALRTGASTALPSITVRDLL